MVCKHEQKSIVTTIMKKAILLGATGLIGSELIKLLLDDARYSHITSISRKEIGIQNPKLKQVTGDLFNMDSFAPEFQDGDDLFIAIGTTKAKTPDKTMYEKIDFGIPTAAAKLANENNIKNLCVVSSMGANSKSSIFYTKLKGRVEDFILDLNIDNVNIVRPSLLLGRSNEKRFGESFGAVVMKNLNFLIPKSSRAIQGLTVAKAMLILANQKNDKQVWMNDELLEMVSND